MTIPSFETIKRWKLIEDWPHRAMCGCPHRLAGKRCFDKAAKPLIDAGIRLTEYGFQPLFKQGEPHLNNEEAKVSTLK